MDSFSLLENPILDCIVLAIIGEIALRVAFEWVGDLYRMGTIDGSYAGHILHWIFRFIIYAVIFYTVATVIKVHTWFVALPDYKWWIIGGVIAAIVAVIISMIVLENRRLSAVEKRR